MGSEINMKLQVPFYSQYSSDVPKDWQNKACGIVAIKMALEAKGVQVPTTPVLIEEGISAGTYRKGIGWTHDGLVEMTQRYGVSAYRKEFRNRFERHFPFLRPVFAKWYAPRGYESLERTLESGSLPIVSVQSVTPGYTHLFLIVGFDDEGVLCHDPAKQSAETGAYIHMSRDKFIKHWRRLAIFVG